MLIKFGKYGTCYCCSEMQRVDLAAGVTGELLEFSQPNVVPRLLLELLSELGRRETRVPAQLLSALLCAEPEKS